MLESFRSAERSYFSHEGKVTKSSPRAAALGTRWTGVSACGRSDFSAAGKVTKRPRRGRCPCVPRGADARGRGTALSALAVLIPCVPLSAGAALGCRAKRIASFETAPYSSSPRGARSNGELCRDSAPWSGSGMRGKRYRPAAPNRSAETSQTAIRRLSLLRKSETAFSLSQEKEKRRCRERLFWQDKRKELVSVRTFRKRKRKGGVGNASFGKTKGKNWCQFVPFAREREKAVSGAYPQ